MGGTYWYVREPDEVLDDLNSSLQGISSKEAQKRLHQYGPNSIANEVRFQLLRNIWEKSNNLLIYILLAAGVISLFAGHMLEFVVIGIIVVITVIMGVVQEHSAGKAITALKQLTAREVWVVRDGKRIQIAAQQLVPGDIVVLDRGMLVPADMRILTTEGLLVDESILHGEPIPKYKVTDALSHQNIPVTDQDNMVFSGTSVTNGQGVGVVVASGLSTELGKISVQLRQLSKQKSPLQKKLDVMTTRISVSVLVVCVILLILLLNADVELAYALLLVAAVAVSGIPESLPLALTVALSSGVRRMAKNHAIIRDLSSVETLGTTTVICTDKTGTLTENKMRVAQAIVGGVHYSVNGKGYEPIGVFSVGDKRVAKESLTTHDEFVQACVLCNNAEIYNHQDDWLLRGEPTEGALLTLAKSSGVDEAVMRERWKRLHVIPFDPLHKFMVTVHRSASKKTNAYLKGAVERVLDRCTHIRKVGKLVVLDARQRKAVHAQVDALSGAALRVLGVASKKLPPKWSTRQSSQLNGGYIFEGLVGMEDPIREEVYDSVKECKSAGVRIIMITGDHRKTAESIARRLGIMGGHDVVLTGGEIEQMTDSELDAQLRHVAVVARATPEHKLRIVSGLQRQGEITAMTGDGVNDAPALKKADIGVAMGKTGTDVARQSANMVLADDSFKSIVKAIEEGRTIYSNIPVSPIEK